METIMNNETIEIIKIIKTTIHDKPYANALLESVFSGRKHSARIMSEGLRERFPHNKAYGKLDDLITNKFFG